jgi:hypothetical protein
MTLQDIIKFISNDRKAILFLGAGFSLEAETDKGKPIPSAKRLSTLLLQEIGITEEAPLSFAADQARENIGNEELYKLLKQNLTIESFSDDQDYILKQPWHRIYTTNFDNTGLKYFPEHKIHDATDEPREVSKGDFIYLHGCLSKCELNNYYHKIKLGEQLYLSGTHTSTSYHDQLMRDLHECDCCIVVGYGMGDENLSATFYNSDAFINKCFVFSGNADAITNYRIELIGNNTNLKLSDLVTLIKTTPKELTFETPTHVKKENNLYDYKPVTQASRQNLLIYGRFDRNIARTAWSNPQEKTYCFNRDLINEIDYKGFNGLYIIHSHFGCGKSIFAEEFMFKASDSGRPIFTLDVASTEEQVLEALHVLPKGSIVIFEGNGFFLKQASQIVKEKSFFILCLIRTTTFRSTYPSLRKEFHSDIKVNTLNKLSEIELNQFEEIIASMGFSSKGKTSLPRNHNHELNAIILNIFQNPQIKELINNAYLSNKNNLTPVFDQFIINSYAKIISIKVPSFVTAQFQNADFKELKKLDNDIILVDSTGNISFTNSIIAEYCFSNLFKEEEIIGAIVRFVNFIGDHPKERTYNWIYRRFLRARNLLHLFNNQHSPLKVFDRTSYVPAIAADPLFWVQYSISQMENDNFFQAWKFVDQAYIRAMKRGRHFNTYQIDTHWVRLLIREANIQGVKDKFAENILEATSKLLRVMQSKPQESTYFVSSIIIEFFNSEYELNYILEPKKLSFLKSDIKKLGQLLKNHTEDSGILEDEIKAQKLIENFLK